MKQYSVEIFFGKDGFDSPLDAAPVGGAYATETKMAQICAESFQAAKNQLKQEHPGARYIHLIETALVDL